MTFVSAGFKITENRGVINDSFGTKALDAKIELDGPCPCCGEKHVYRAGELSCPFDIPVGSGGARKGQSMVDESEKVQLTKTVTGSG